MDTKQTFAEAISTLFAEVDRALTSADGYTERELCSAEIDIGKPIPTRLREYYLLSGKASFNQAFNRFLKPDQFEQHGDKIVFCEENQWVAHWAFSVDDSDDDDPCVWQKCDSTWEVQHDRMSVFLKKMFCWQAVMGGLAICAHGKISEQANKRFEETCERVEIDSDDEPRVFILNRIVACVFSTAGGHDIYAGSNDYEAISWLAESFDLDLV